ncbi:hypothetical protein EIN_274820 [Entamoeba invadens IP1]|uniref:Uncharacterized protein n=1 Tax=Entamoeba invadens IP1 TaxID=370355 RepID=A0A0A1U1J4_ENTIV|nr:hypothetical protein EIN_274820 [Entamoeba invadens IP1]ELP87895.1 hypothetical protein EIN_274820 [Entamoeba invadens IP1]|eukprot:XP_004254666.1 hypothetical protein EIN_274820 [Entamoeba invadens IP1]
MTAMKNILECVLGEVAPLANVIDMIVTDERSKTHDLNIQELSLSIFKSKYFQDLKKMAQDSLDALSRYEAHLTYNGKYMFYAPIKEKVLPTFAMLQKTLLICETLCNDWLNLENVNRAFVIEGLISAVQEIASFSTQEQLCRALNAFLKFDVETFIAFQKSINKQEEDNKAKRYGDLERLLETITTKMQNRHTVFPKSKKEYFDSIVFENELFNENRLLFEENMRATLKHENVKAMAGQKSKKSLKKEPTEVHLPDVISFSVIIDNKRIISTVLIREDDINEDVIITKKYFPYLENDGRVFYERSSLYGSVIGMENPVPLAKTKVDKVIQKKDESKKVKTSVDQESERLQKAKEKHKLLKQSRVKSLLHEISRISCDRIQKSEIKEQRQTFKTSSYRRTNEERLATSSDHGKMVCRSVLTRDNVKNSRPFTLNGIELKETIEGVQAEQGQIPFKETNQEVEL